jgi:Rrf2 family protein
MLPLSLTVGHAIRLLRCLDEPGGQRMQVESVAACIGVSKTYLSKIAHHLGQQKFLDCQRGHHGGVLLTRPLREITLEQVSAAIDGTKWRSRCFIGLPGCSEASPCILQDYWAKTQQEIIDQLRQVTLEDMNRHHDPGVEACIALRLHRKNTLLLDPDLAVPMHCQARVPASEYGPTEALAHTHA